MITIDINRISGVNGFQISVTSDSKITDIYIDTQRTFNCGENESINAYHIEVTEEENNVEDGIYNYTRDIRLDAIMPSSTGNALLNSNVETDLFIIYAYNKALYSKKELFYDSKVLKEYVFNILYDSILSTRCCETNTSSIDLLLLYNAFNLATSYKDKIFFWNKIHLHNYTENSNCSCNG